MQVRLAARPTRPARPACERRPPLAPRSLWAWHAELDDEAWGALLAERAVFSAAWSWDKRHAASATQEGLAQHASELASELVRRGWARPPGPPPQSSQVQPPPSAAAAAQWALDQPPGETTPAQPPRGGAGAPRVPRGAAAAADAGCRGGPDGGRRGGRAHRVTCVDDEAEEAEAEEGGDHTGGGGGGSSGDDSDSLSDDVEDQYESTSEENEDSILDLDTGSASRCAHCALLSPLPSPPGWADPRFSPLTPLPVRACVCVGGGGGGRLQAALATIKRVGEQEAASLQLRGMDLRIRRGLGKQLATVVGAARGKGVGKVELAQTNVEAITREDGGALAGEVLRLVAAMKPGRTSFVGLKGTGMERPALLEQLLKVLQDRPAGGGGGDGGGASTASSLQLELSEVI